jgi:hypothetical protein
MMNLAVGPASLTALGILLAALSLFIGRKERAAVRVVAVQRPHRQRSAFPRQ